MPFLGDAFSLPRRRAELRRESPSTFTPGLHVTFRKSAKSNVFVGDKFLRGDNTKSLILARVPLLVGVSASCLAGEPTATGPWFSASIKSSNLRSGRVELFRFNRFDICEAKIKLSNLFQRPHLKLPTATSAELESENCPHKPKRNSTSFILSDNTCQSERQ